MSVISSRKSSLLTRSFKERSSTSSLKDNKSSHRIVRFKLNYNLKNVLESEAEQKKYRDLVCQIRDAGRDFQDEDILQILNEARGCVQILNKSHKLFVQVLLLTKWAHRSEAVAEVYKAFMLDLCAAHNYYTKFAIDQLISNFKPAGELSEWLKEQECESEDVIYRRVHSVLKVLLQVIPMSLDLLVTSISDNFPYIRSKEPSDHATYITNVLDILNYRPDLRTQFLSLIFTKLLLLDVNAPRSDLVQMEVDDATVFPLEESVEGMNNPVADALDLSLEVMFSFIRKQCHKNNVLCWERTKAFYVEIMIVFDQVILPTHDSHYVQFLIFYFLSFEENLVTMFLYHLWRKVIDPNVYHVIRQAAICYTASLLSRAKYTSVSVVRESLTRLSVWIQSYILSCDEQTTSDPRVHNVFYCMCQAMFYLIAFRHKEIITSPKGMKFLEELNLGKVVFSKLNPLRACLPVVAQNFAAVARHYQLVYCFSVIENNQRSTIPIVYQDSSSVQQIYLDTFFPFDPYLLTRTRRYISELYREYDHTLPEDKGKDILIPQEKKRSGKEDDDFIMEQSSINNPDFTYSTSPGFKMHSYCF